MYRDPLDLKKTHSYDILVPSPSHFKGISGTFYRNLGDILWIFWVHLGDIFGQLHSNSDGNGYCTSSILTKIEGNVSTIQEKRTWF